MTISKAAKATRSKPARKRTTPAETVLVLRTCAADMTAHGGFRWPESGEVSAPDWNPAPICGQGLHGALWGEGNGALLSFEADAKWLVVEVVAADVVELDGKVKFPRCVVLFVGDRLTATAYLRAEMAARGRPLGATIGAVVQSGYGGTSTSGDGGTSTSGYGGTSTSGDGGTLVLCWYDSDAERYRLAIAYVGEGGILPDKPYRLDVTRDAAGVLSAVFVKAS